MLILRINYAIANRNEVNHHLRRHLNANEKVRVLTLLQEGRSQRYIANIVGTTQSVVSRLLRKHTETGNDLRRHGSGRRRKTTVAEDRFMRIQVLRNRTATARDVQRDLLRATGRLISDQTVRNRLHKAQMASRRPAKVRQLLVRHRQARLQFAREHRHWQLQHWRPVMFSDESRFTVSGHDGRTRVWRRPGEHYIPAAMVETKAHGGGSVMVWGGITMYKKTDLIIARNGNLTAQRYMNEILDTQVRRFAHDVGQEFLFMQDNARPHVANVVQTYVCDHQIKTLPWPACSPDLNPIEHLWDKLGRAIKIHPNPPTTVEELVIAVVEEWQRIPQEDIRRLIRSMPRRCNSVITARGGNTPY